MDNEKLDAILNLSLETEESIRAKSDILNNGYDRENSIWEVIVKYNGDISFLEQEVESLELLLNGYAIMQASRVQLERVLDVPQIEYVEIPKSLVFDAYREKQLSCVLPLSVGAQGLRGEGILIAVIDSGIQYLLPDFQNENGSRILYLWDQSIETDETAGFLPPEGFQKGVEFTKEQIDQAISAAAGSRTGATVSGQAAAFLIVPSTDRSGHGTAVTGIAAGSAASPLYQGMAPESELLIVKLGENHGMGRSKAGDQNFPLTTDLMRAITYVVLKAEEIGRPVAINISIGDTYGAHDGTSLLERFADAACEKGRNVICIGSGNEAVSAGHRRVRLVEITEGNRGMERVELAVADNERSVNVQIWKNYVDVITLSLTAPGGERYGIDLSRSGKQEWQIQNTRVLIYVSPPVPYSVNEEIFLDFIPTQEYIDEGIWTFEPSWDPNGGQDVHFFLPNGAVRNTGTRFLQPDPYLSMTIPAFASRAVTVGAYDGVLNAAADFSGRDRYFDGTERAFFATNVKPDLAAPGVDILAPATDGGYRSFTGTSFATPIVTGSAALLLEWGIVRGNDPFLYGEKIKAFLRRGAVPFLDGRPVPNAVTGYGKLCLSESIPKITD